MKTHTFASQKFSFSLLLPILLFGFLMAYSQHSAGQWEATLELNEADGSISISFLSEHACVYEIFWGDSLVGAEAQWRRAVKDIVADASGTNVWIDTGDATRSHPSLARRRFYHVAIQEDSDRDGLTDAEEHFVYKTDPHGADSDSDNLLDGDEVSIHDTDPLDPDSDGGGMADGAEVAFGFDPKESADDSADSDSDGLSNAMEAILRTNPSRADTDEDGLSDGQEVGLETDPRNGDTDTDGLSDPNELQEGTDPKDADSDDDGMPDGWEADNSLDPLSDDSNSDPDGDTLVNFVEYALKTDPQNSDSDGDGISDDAETLVVFRTNAGDAKGDGKLDFGAETWVVIDADGDGSLEAYAFAGIIFCAGTGFDGTLIGKTSDMLDIYEKGGDVYVDIDDAETGDENNELAKYFYVPAGAPTTAPLLPYAADGRERWRDCDGDDIIDPLDDDSDGDGVPDRWENANGCNPYDAADAFGDNESDGLTNLEEYQLGTDPNNNDSDGDGIADALEKNVGTDPVRSDSGQDFDNDGLSNVVEHQNGTGMNDPDSDDDGILDGSEANWNSDTDGDGLINALDADSDDDGLDDGQELDLGTDPLLPDTDGDNLTDLEELQIETDPTDTDTDDDGITDDLDPVPVNSDADGDGLNDGQEATLDAVWYGVAELADGESVLLDDPEAKGGKCLVHKATGSEIFNRARQLVAGTYRLFVRAKTFRMFQPVPNAGFEDPAVVLPPAPAHWSFAAVASDPAMAPEPVYPAQPALSGTTGAGMQLAGVEPGSEGKWIQILDGPFDPDDEYTLSVSFLIQNGHGFGVDAAIVWKAGFATIREDWSRKFPSDVWDVWTPAIVSSMAPPGATDLEIHLRASTSVDPGDGLVVFDDVVLTRVGDKVQLSIIDEAGTDLTGHNSIPDTHCITSIYRWVSTPDFSLTWDSVVNLVASDPQSADGNIVAVDRALLVRVESPSPRLTDPLDPDTDGDGIVDGAERAIDAYWYQAEDFCFSRNEVLDCPGAANGKEVMPVAAGPLCHISEPTLPLDGDYTIYVRARTLNLSDISNVRVIVMVGDGATAVEHTIQPVRFVGLDTTVQPNVPIYANLYEWFPAVQPKGLGWTAAPSIASLDPTISVSGETGIGIEVLAEGADKDNVRLDAVLLVKGDYTPAEMSAYTSEEGIEFGENILLLPRISNPMDPDTDLDGYRPDDGFLPGSKGYLTDGFEFDRIGSNAFAIDTDLDGEPDNADLNPLSDDTDNDGLKDRVEEADGPGYPTSIPGEPNAKTSPVDPDSDDDGILDGNEDINLDQSLDPGEANPVVIDTDGDGLTDGQEIGLLEPQGEGAGTHPDKFRKDEDPSTRTKSYDNDSDEDGLLDGTEDADRNGRRDDTETGASQFDTDHDGLSDGLELGLNVPEAGADTDGAKFQPDSDAGTTTDPLVADSDGDGLSEGLEDKNTNGKVDGDETDPNNPDTDGDELRDGEEVNVYGSNPLSNQSDRDGLNDREEVMVYHTSPASEDSDGDGLWDGEDVRIGDLVLHKGEMTAGTNPRLADTDGDGLNDGIEVNGFSATVNGEAKWVTSDPLDRDPDGDGLRDEQEHSGRTDPRVADTDGDGLSDFAEVNLYKSNPNEADDDRDGLNDALEVKLGTNPRLADTDGDHLPDGHEDGNRNGIVDMCETDPANRDTDGDGVNDDKEVLYSSQTYSEFLFSWEAEQEQHDGWFIGDERRYGFTPRQKGDLIPDLGSGATGAGAISTETSPDGEYVVEISNIVSHGIYQFYVRLRIQPDEGSKATYGCVSIRAGWDSYLMSGNHHALTKYRWYATYPCWILSDHAVLKVAGCGYGGYDVYVDRLVLVRLDEAPPRLRGGQVTLPGPGESDTDDDGIPDAAEVKSGVYWLEAENLGRVNVCPEMDERASNGRAVSPLDYSKPVVDYNSASSVFNLEPGSYSLWVRARAFSSFANQRLTVRVEETPTVSHEEEFSFTDTTLYHWFNFNQVVGATDTDFDVKITCSSTGEDPLPYIYVDRLLFVRSSYGNLGEKDKWGTVTDPLHADTDGGGSRDGDELADDEDDGVDNPLDPVDDDADFDGDGLTDAFEKLTFGPWDPDGDGLPPYQDPDSDNDGLGDRFELDTFGLADPDGLLVPPLDRDSDNDGLDDKYELENFGLFDVDGDGKSPPLDYDSDGDYILDSEEDAILGDSNPDGDFLPGGKPRIPVLDPDSDNDGLTDYEELYQYVGRVSDPLNPDTDGDGLSEGDEAYVWHTDWTRKDTDGDLLDDNLEIEGWEITTYTIRTATFDPERRVYGDPNSGQDRDGDGLDDYGEYLKSDPEKADTDGDGLDDRQDDNPLGVENEPPHFYWESWGTDWQGFRAKYHLEVEAYDNVGLKEIKIEGRKKWTFDDSPRSSTKEYTKWVYPISSYDFKIIVTDVNGNTESKEVHVKSAFEALGDLFNPRDLVKRLFDFVEGALAKLQDAAKALVKEFVKKALSAFSAVESYGNVFVQSAIVSIRDEMEDYVSVDCDPESYGIRITLPEVPGDLADALEAIDAAATGFGYELFRQALALAQPLIDKGWLTLEEFEDIVFGAVEDVTGADVSGIVGDLRSTVENYEEAMIEAFESEDYDALDNLIKNSVSDVAAYFVDNIAVDRLAAGWGVLGPDELINAPEGEDPIEYLVGLGMDFVTDLRTTGTADFPCPQNLIQIPGGGGMPPFRNLSDVAELPAGIGDDEIKIAVAVSVLVDVYEPWVSIGYVFVGGLLEDSRKFLDVYSFVSAGQSTFYWQPEWEPAPVDFNIAILLPGCQRNAAGLGLTIWTQEIGIDVPGLLDGLGWEDVGFGGASLTHIGGAVGITIPFLFCNEK